MTDNPYLELPFYPRHILITEFEKWVDTCEQFIAEFTDSGNEAYLELWQNNLRYYQGELELLNIQR